MSEFEIWAYRGIIAVAFLILWWGFQRLIKKFDELIKSIEKLTLQNQSHNDRLKVLDEVVRDHRVRINKHDDRIRKIEQKVSNEDQ